MNCQVIALSHRGRGQCALDCSDIVERDRDDFLGIEVVGIEDRAIGIVDFLDFFFLFFVGVDLRPLSSRYSFSLSEIVLRFFCSS